MRITKAALLCLSLALPMAATADVLEGRDYVVLTPSVLPPPPGKIEVTEFFAYSCPHSFRLEAMIRPWARAQPTDVALRPVPVALPVSVATPGAQLFYALEAMGAEDRLRGAIFAGVHVSHSLSVADPRAFPGWLAPQGVDKTKFSEVFASFPVQTKVQRATQLAQAARVDSTPMVLVNGRYRIVAPSAMTPEHFAEVATAVVARARKDQQR